MRRDLRSLRTHPAALDVAPPRTATRSHRTRSSATARLPRAGRGRLRTRAPRADHPGSTRAARSCGGPRGVGSPSGAPVLPERGAVRSGPRRRRPADRCGADLDAGADGAAPACMLLTLEPAAVRVRERRGGGPRGRGGRRPGSRCLLCRGAEGGLTQGRELECRADGLSHPLTKRAWCWPACRQRGEHVFVKVGGRSDGTGSRRGAAGNRFGSAPRKVRPHPATGLANAIAVRSTRIAARPPGVSRRSPAGTSTAGAPDCGAGRRVASAP